MKITNNRKDGFEEFENDRKILKEKPLQAMLVEISIDLYITVKISFLVTKNKRIAYRECIYAH